MMRKPSPLEGQPLEYKLSTEELNCPLFGGLGRIRDGALLP